MSLERKDVRFKIDPDAHGALAVLAEIDQLDIGEWCTQVVLAEVGRRLHAAKVVSERAERLGILGKTGELPGIAPLGPPVSGRRR